MGRQLLVCILIGVCGLLMGVVGTGVWVKRIALGKSLAALATGYENLDKREFDRAIAMFNQSLAFVPEHYEPHVGLGQAYEGLGLLDIALREYKLAAGLVKIMSQADRVEKTIILARIGDIYLQKETYQEAQHVYTEAIALYPNWPDPYYGLGTVYYRIGNAPEAKENLLNYVRLETRKGRAERKRAAEDLLSKLGGHDSQR